jgi:hypothetical protein
LLAGTAPAADEELCQHLNVVLFVLPPAAAAAATPDLTELDSRLSVACPSKPRDDRCLLAASEDGRSRTVPARHSRHIGKLTACRLATPTLRRGEPINGHQQCASNGCGIAQGVPMARLRTTRAPHGILVSVSGRFGAADMGRLEHACRDALTHNPLQLHLDLTHVTSMDGTAAALVQRLRERGAHVRTAAVRVVEEFNQQNHAQIER